MRPPRKLRDFTTAEEAAKVLEDMAAMIRSAASGRPIVKYFIRLDYWNPDWLDKSKDRPNTIVTGIDYSKQPLPQGAGPRAAAGKK